MLLTTERKSLLARPDIIDNQQAGFVPEQSRQRRILCVSCAGCQRSRHFRRQVVGRREELDDVLIADVLLERLQAALARLVIDIVRQGGPGERFLLFIALSKQKQKDRDALLKRPQVFKLGDARLAITLAGLARLGRVAVVVAGGKLDSTHRPRTLQVM